MPLNDFGRSASAAHVGINWIVRSPERNEHARLLPGHRAQAAITAAARQLPRDLFPPPAYRKVNPADSPVLILSVRSDVLPLTRVDDYADNILAQQISQVS